MRAKKNAAPEKTQGQEIIEAISDLCKDKDINEDAMFHLVENALKKAFEKNQPAGAPKINPSSISVVIDRVTGEFHVYMRRLIVEEIENPAADQIALEDALKIKDTYKMGDIVETDVTPTGFLRVAAETARDLIIQSMARSERKRVYDSYIEKENEILSAVVRRFDSRGNAYVELMGRAEGILEVDEMIPGEVLQEEDHIKVYVLDVQRAQDGNGRSPQVHVSRVHPNLIKRLFELEVPEIAAGTVSIKAIAREAGSRTKIAVDSSDAQIDPVGSCVGQRGSRVDRVVTELKGEKIDIIKWSGDIAEFIANALNPANVQLVLKEASGARSCRVVVPDNQLSLAIGKEGQNARLAAKLTGWKIDIKSQSQYEEMLGEMMPEEEEEQMPLEGTATTFETTYYEGDDDTQ